MNQVIGVQHQMDVSEEYKEKLYKEAMIRAERAESENQNLKECIVRMVMERLGVLDG